MHVLLTKFVILMKLNLNQKEAVQYSEGPLLLVVGPGSGKPESLLRESYT